MLWGMVALPHLDTSHYGENGKKEKGQEEEKVVFCAIYKKREVE
tara:strand:+ start:797 stop:928 length:132 start_codon:yes stop_codon:yes gene_type:complete